MPDVAERARAEAARVQEGAQETIDNIICQLREYAREKPEAAALWCLGIGFVLGWKLKPW